MTQLRDMDVVWRETASLSAHPNNPRTHSPQQKEQLFASVSRFGWTCPLIVDEDLTILAGHGRWEMAQDNLIIHVPTIMVKGLSEDEKRAYLLADNKLSENANWDYAALVSELDYLSSVAIEADTLGFSDADILGYQSEIDDTCFTEPTDIPQTRASLDSPARIESSTEPTQLQPDREEYQRPVPLDAEPAEVAATLVPFSLMLPADDRERVYRVLENVAADSMAEALMVVIDAFDATDGQESESEQE